MRQEALVRIIKFDVLRQLFTFLYNKQTFNNIFVNKRLERAWSGPDRAFLMILQTGPDRIRRFISSLALTGLPDQGQTLPDLAPTRATLSCM